MNKREIYRTWETDKPWIPDKGLSIRTDPQDGLKYTVKFERYVKALKFDDGDVLFSIRRCKFTILNLIQLYILNNK